MPGTELGVPHTLHTCRVAERLPEVTANMATCQKQQKYDVHFKLRAFQYARAHSKEATACNFGVDTKQIKEWVKQKEKFLAMKKCGKVNRAAWLEMDEGLKTSTWRKLHVSRNMISKARDPTTTSCHSHNRKTMRVLYNKLHERLDHFVHPGVLTEGYT